MSSFEETLKYSRCSARVMIVALALVFVASGSVASESHPHRGGHSHGHHGYVDLQQRQVSGLSNEELDQLRSGEGMGMALAAELNGYPGPRHVLDLAEELALSDGQRDMTTTLFERMQREASAAGERYIRKERALDALFAEGRATEEAVREHTLSAAQAYGEIRAIHLRYHLEMMQVLSRHQVHQYQRARGYGSEMHGN
ncbi:MAG: hypothetical protein LAT50_05240 [Ectothiorhodospiraceae bacterium]|nr:hypothetical protein [Ectothiorhodospiraceae bacterium]